MILAALILRRNSKYISVMHFKGYYANNYVIDASTYIVFKLEKILYIYS